MNKLNLLIAVCLAGWLNAVPVQAQVRTPTIYGYYNPFTGDWYRVYYNPDGSVRIEGGMGSAVTNLCRLLATKGQPAGAIA